MRKDPGLAAVLSFFHAGLGQIYNGEIFKGLLYIVIQFVNFLLIFVFIGLITWPLFWIWGMIEAYNTAQDINESRYRRARYRSSYYNYRPRYYSSDYDY